MVTESLEMKICIPEHTVTYVDLQRVAKHSSSSSNCCIFLEERRANQDY